ncbi:hypothetical protein F5888DRAFT_917007 [Russula emetica]|nr:hypothetical protein F5888DRAFT_917007 [Russula emetica]
MSTQLSTLGRVGGGRVKRKYKGASMSTHGTSARLLRAAHPKDTVHCRRRASSLPFSTCLTVSEEESRLYNSQYPSFPTTSFSIAESKNNALQASNRVIETDASITTVTLGSLPLHPHGRHPFRLSTFRGDQTPRIYVHPTEGARTSFSQMCMTLNVLRTGHPYAEQALRVRGRETIVFRKYMNRGGIGSDEESDIMSRASRYSTPYTWPGKSMMIIERSLCPTFP